MRNTHLLWASQLLSARLSSTAVKERPRHSDVRTTLQIYAHVFKEEEDDVVAVIEQEMGS